MRSSSTVVAILTTLLLCLALAPRDARPRTQRDDGRIGTVVDRHGLAFVRARGRDRWTPITKSSLLLPGDSVKTRVDGANAVEIGWSGGGTLLVGPGTLLELGTREVELLRGECEVSPGNLPVTVGGPGRAKAPIATATVLRAEGKATTILTEPPRWLSSYRSSTTSDWMGSLVAKIDGRDVPLDLAQHEVHVTIRDGVAETSIEQVYHNRTASELEGSFRFPLPVGASVSGFAMWVGSELVEADIVERTRARAIFEDLKRRKIDPGLLEWSGGNEFTARVWPIPAGGGKRIRIRYTQLLEFDGTGYRYSTALRTGALAAQPVRSARVRAEVMSDRELTAVASPTHPVQITSGASTATVEWSAEQFVPDRDFELRIDVRGSDPLSIVDHVRDGDGWFAARIVPPHAQGGWERQLVTDGEPIDLILACDTSGSMDARARERQAEVVAALLGSLGPRDRFRLFASDLAAEWFAAGAQPAEPERITAALAFLAARPSLGWTDLDLVLDRAIEAASPNSTLVYIGDGLLTTGDADGRAFARRAEGKLDELHRKGHALTVHTVAVRNTLDVKVLGTLALAGGGSFINADTDPTAAVAALLRDALAPRLVEAKLTIDGVETARVYPARLPNVAAGRERLIVGRYRPTGSAVNATLRLSGKLNGEAVAWTVTSPLGGSERGDAKHSYLPRLWAVAHIDELLDEGQTAAIREAVIAHSIEYQVMTPLTSLLVLESDADRERYGVTRRVKLRDGEAFFAAAGEAAQRDRMESALKDAARWRANLRQAALAEIAALGRPSTDSVAYGGQRFGVRYQLGETVRTLGVDERLAFSRGIESFTAVPGSAPAGIKGGDVFDDLSSLEATPEGFDSFEIGGDRELVDIPAEEEHLGKSRAAGASREGIYLNARRVDRLGYFHQAADSSIEAAGSRFRASTVSLPLHTLGVPGLGEFVAQETPPREPIASRDDLALLASLDRRADLRSLDGVELVLETRQQHAKTSRLTSFQRTTVHWHRGAWFQRDEDSSADRLDWLLAGRRGVVDLVTLLGRERDAAEREFDEFVPPGLWSTGVDALAQWHGHRIERVRSDGNLVVLRVLHDGVGDYRTELVIDQSRRLVMEWTTSLGATPQSSSRVTAVAMLDGIAVPTRVETRDEDGNVTTIHTAAPRRLDRGESERTIAGLRSRAASALLLDATDPKANEARDAAYRGKASLTQQLALFAHALDRSNHSLAERWLAAAKATMGTHPAMPSIERIHTSRVGSLATLLAQLRSAIEALAVLPASAERGLALRALERYIRGDFAPYERLALHRRLRALDTVFLTAELAPLAELRWRREEAILVAAMGDEETSRAMRRETAKRFPWDLATRFDLASILADEGDRKAAAAEFESMLTAEGQWTQPEREQVFQQLLDLHWREREMENSAAVAQRWIAAGTRSTTPFVARWTALLYRDGLETVLQEVDAIIDASRTMADSVRGTAPARAVADFLTGQTRGVHRWRVLRDDHERLDRFLRNLVTSDAGWSIAMTLFTNDRIAVLDRSRTLRAELSRRLDDRDAVATMSFVALDSILRLVDATVFDDSQWRTRRVNLEARIAATVERFERGQLAQRLLELCDARNDAAAAIDVLRARVADPRDRDTVLTLSAQLVARLTARPFTPELETEVFRLLVLQTDGEVQPRRSAAELAGFAAETAFALVAARVRAALPPIEELEKLARAERRRREAIAKPIALRAVADRFGEVARDRPKDVRRVLELESLCLAAQSGDAPTATRDALLAWIASSEAAANANTAARHFADRQGERAGLALAWLGVRRGATPDFVDRLITDFDGFVGQPPVGHTDWRGDLARFLVALDRTDHLRGRVETWLNASGELLEHLRQLRAWIAAGAGDFARANADYTELAAAVGLSNDDWRTVFGWRLALGDTAGAAAANRERYAALDIWGLHALLSAEAARIRSAAGERIDPLVLDAARAIVRKGQNQRWATRAVQELWLATKDHRVLAAVAEGVLGQSDGGRYEILRGLRELLTQVHEEAALDALANELRSHRAVVDSEVDRRALHFALYLVAARATRLPIGSESARRQVEESLREMAKIIDGPFEDGEAVQLANLCAELDALPTTNERALRLRIVRTLLDRSVAGSSEQLAIAHAHARCQAADGDLEGAAETLVRACEAAAGDRERALPARARQYVGTIVDYRRQTRRFLVAEREVADWQKRASTASEREFFATTLDQLYAEAVRVGGATSLGEGDAQYQRAEQRLRARVVDLSLPTSGLESRVRRLCDLHAANMHGAGHSGRTAASRALLAFASEHLATLEAVVAEDANDLTTAVVDTLIQLDAKEPALTMLVERALRNGARDRRLGRGQWSAFEGRIAELRHKLKVGGKLRADIRALVLRELEDELASVGNDYSSIWSRGSSYYWFELEDEFRTVAAKVIELHGEEPAVVEYAARALRDRFGAVRPAIDALAGLAARDKLAMEGRALLTEWLLEASEFAAAVPHAKVLVGIAPQVLRHHGMWIRALGQSSKAEEARAALKSAIERFVDPNRRDANVEFDLGSAAASGGLLAEAADLVGSAVATRARTVVGPDSLLREYYRAHGGLLGQLGRHEAAIDAFLAAFAQADQQRDQESIRHDLGAALAAGGEPAEWRARWDARTASDGYDVPLLRLALASLFEDDGDFAAAAEQYRIAIATSGNDRRGHDGLIKALDRLGNAKAALAASLAAATAIPGNSDLLLDLARRWRADKQPTNADRALSELVEHTPHEADGHRRLAEELQALRRPTEAITQWRQVVRARPDDHGGSLALARLLVEQGQREAAREVLDAMLRRSDLQDPDAARRDADAILR
ncbi:MAG: VIT domain-containing protein [Planctomycetota bacterium]